MRLLLTLLWSLLWQLPIAAGNVFGRREAASGGTVSLVSSSRCSTFCQVMESNLRFSEQHGLQRTDSVSGLGVRDSCMLAGTALRSTRASYLQVAARQSRQRRCSQLAPALGA